MASVSSCRPSPLAPKSLTFRTPESLGKTMPSAARDALPPAAATANAIRARAIATRLNPCSPFEAQNSARPPAPRRRPVELARGRRELDADLPEQLGLVLGQEVLH